MQLLDLNKGKPKGKGPEKLLIDVSTRWNSSFEMLERFMKMEPAVVATLMTKEVRKDIKDVNSLSDTDLSNLEAALGVLQPMKMITIAMSGCSSPTISLILPFKYQLLLSMETQQDDSPFVMDIKDAIRKDLRPR